MALLRDHLLPQLMGADADRIEQIWNDLRRSVHALTVGPIASLALAADDTALWDLRSRRAGLPLHIAAGGAQRSVPVYSTEGGWLHLSTADLVADALAVKERGLHGAKLKIGKPTIGEDLDRLTAVRDAVGPDWELMIDANQAFKLDEAVRRAAAFRELGLPGSRNRLRPTTYLAIPDSLQQRRSRSPSVSRSTASGSSANTCTVTSA